MIRVRHDPCAMSHLASNEPHWSTNRSGERRFILRKHTAHLLDRITPSERAVTLTIWWPTRQGGEGTPENCSNQSRMDLHITHRLPSETRAHEVASDFARSERARLVALAIQHLDVQRTALQGLPT